MSDEALFQRRMAKRLQKKKEPKIDTRSETDKEIDTVVAETKLQERQKLLKKKNRKRAAQGAGVLVLGYLIYLGLLVPPAGIGYGVCKVFTELNVRFPDTLYFSSVEPFATSLRVWYTHIDSFGEYKLESIQCFFKPDPAGQLPFVIDRIAINRRDIDSERVEEFNNILPVVFAHPPDLTYPAALPDSLRDIQFDTDRFRKNLGLK